MKPKLITITELAKQFPPDGQMGKHSGRPVVGPIPMRYWFKHEKSIRAAIARCHRRMKVWYMNPSLMRDNFKDKSFKTGRSSRAALKAEASHAAIYLDPNG